MARLEPKDRIIYPDLGVTDHARLWEVSRQRADQILNRPARHARQAVQTAIKSGRMVKPKTCERCSKGRRPIQAHHSDYTKRLEVQWLCRKCHGIVHPHHPYANRPTPRRDRYCIDCAKLLSPSNGGIRCHKCGVAYRSHKLTCPECLNEFVLSASTYSRRSAWHLSNSAKQGRIFCSHSCSSKYWWKQNPFIVSP